MACYGYDDTPLSFNTLQQLLRRTLPDACIDIYQLPGCRFPTSTSRSPEQTLSLGLINHDYQTGPLDADTMQAVIREPAYWAFCWGSGLALAQLLARRPDWVTGKHVVDLGSGSGVAAIAAALAGAAHVVACDTDADARAATRINAEYNHVDIDVSAELPASCDLILMADVLYDRANLPLLQLAQLHGREVLVADSRVTSLPTPEYHEIDQINALTLPNLGEFDEYGTAHIFHYASTAQQTG